MVKNVLENGIWHNSDLDKNAAYKDDRIAIVDSIQSLKNGQTNLAAMVKVDAVLLVFCVKGKASFFINGNSYMLHPNDLMICVPNIVFEKSMISIDFEMRAVILSPEYMKSMVLFECSSWSFRSFVEQHPVFSLNNDEARLFKQYYNLLYEKLTGTPRKHQKELFDALLEMFHYDFYDTMERFYNENPKTFSSSEVLFRNFLELLNVPGNNCRKVAFYFRKLWIIVLGLGILTFSFFGTHTLASRIVSIHAQNLKSSATCIYWLFYYLGSSLIGSLTGIVFVSNGWFSLVEILLLLLLGALIIASLFIFKYRFYEKSKVYSHHRYGSDDVHSCS